MEDMLTHEFNLDFNTTVENLVLRTIGYNPGEYRLAKYSGFYNE